MKFLFVLKKLLENKYLNTFSIYFSWLTYLYSPKTLNYIFKLKNSFYLPRIIFQFCTSKNEFQNLHRYINFPIIINYIFQKNIF
jgi:hypothetical protein